jgi:mannose-1-phosphate guanylyltransferase
MQALILAGGEGTRLRPLTSTIPKPVVPLVDRPFIVYMLQWLRGHGVDDVILLCGFMSDGVKDVLGDGGDLGLRIRYVQEPRPLGTGGALRFSEALLDDRFFMLNGDVLTDIDLTAQLAQHERTEARATLGLVPVDDPTAYGLVRRNPDLSVREFVEKPSADAIDTNLISAGAYILQRDVLEIMAPAGETISIERDVFPKLVGAGLYGYEASGYWLDIGTPERYLQATFDILEGRVRTDAGRAPGQAGIADGVGVAGPSSVGVGCEVSRGATVGARTVLGARVTIADGAHVENSVLLDGCTIGPRSYVHSSIIGRRAVIGADCQVADGVVLGEQVKLGAANVLGAGARIFPNVELPDRAIKV